jgi:hypothetical protein
MKKHCHACGLELEDTMGVWKCYLCGGELEEGFGGGWNSMNC